MARRKNAPESIRVKHGLSERLRSLRTEFYGERGGPDLARTLGIPVRTWYNYENGVTVPAEIILRIVELTAVEPVWLLRGEGPKFRPVVGDSAGGRAPTSAEGLAASPITTLLRVALERLEEEERIISDHPMGLPMMSRWVGLGLDDPATESGAGDSLDGTRPILAEPKKAVRNLRIDDDAMAPIVADGAHVAYGESEPVSESFHDKLVVAWVEGKPLVRWFQHCGRFALLRAENPATTPPSILVELEREGEVEKFHRVLWISTPH